MATWAVPDPVLVAARLERERVQDERVAAILAAEQAELDARGMKVCVFPNDCAELVPAGASTCPGCRRPQGLGIGGVASAAARTIQVKVGERGMSTATEAVDA